jgi:hypothetical protein
MFSIVLGCVIRKISEEVLALYVVPNTSRRVLIILGYYNNVKFSHEIADIERVKEVK